MAISPDELRKSIGEKLIDWGNIVFAALVVGQAFARDKFDPLAMLGGVIVWLGAFILAVKLMKGGKK